LDAKTKKKPKAKGQFQTNPKYPSDPYAEGEDLMEAHEIAGSSVAPPESFKRSSLSSEGW